MTSVRSKRESHRRQRAHARNAHANAHAYVGAPTGRVARSATPDITAATIVVSADQHNRCRRSFRLHVHLVV
eukprot:1476581-Prymnesium_polylepis.1